MNEPLYLYCFLIFIAAGWVKGVTGMGLPTVAMGLLGTVMPLVEAAALLVIPSLVTNLWQLFSGPILQEVLRRLWLMMMFIVIGTVVGSFLLVSIPPLWAGVGLGVALIIYASYALCRPAMHVSARLERLLSPVMGLVTGFVTGATGVFVMPAVPWLQSLRFGRDELVQALGLSFTVSTIALAAGLYLHDAFHVRQLSLSGMAIIPALLGMWLGQKIRARIGLRLFRLCFLLFLTVLGLEMISRPLLA